MDNKDQRIIDVNIEDEVKKSFIGEYCIPCLN
jgi:hypothetical protein